MTGMKYFSICVRLGFISLKTIKNMMTIFLHDSKNTLSIIYFLRDFISPPRIIQAYCISQGYPETNKTKQNQQIYLFLYLSTFICLYTDIYIQIYICMSIYVYIHWTGWGADRETKTEIDLLQKKIAHMTMEAEKSWSEVSKLETQESQWFRLQSKLEGLRNRRVKHVSCSPRTEDRCLSPSQ